MRSEAENANVRARAKREVDDARQYAVQKFAADVVEAAENLRRGIDEPAPGHAERAGDRRQAARGVRGRRAQFPGHAGAQRHHAATTRPDEPFDPNLHQAMAEQESAAHPPGTVMQAWTRAWTLNGRLLRPAMVVVAKARRRRSNRLAPRRIPSINRTA